jgi:hypothetical protein
MILRVDPISLAALILLAIMVVFAADAKVKYEVQKTTAPIANSLQSLDPYADVANPTTHDQVHELEGISGE